MCGGEHEYIDAASSPLNDKVAKEMAQHQALPKAIRRCVGWSSRRKAVLVVVQCMSRHLGCSQTGNGGCRDVAAGMRWRPRQRRSLFVNKSIDAFVILASFIGSKFPTTFPIPVLASPIHPFNSRS